MYAQSIRHLEDLAGKKVAVLKAAPLSFIVSSLMAGAYVGMGIILIFTIAPPSTQVSRSLPWVRPSGLP